MENGQGNAVQGIGKLFDKMGRRLQGLAQVLLFFGIAASVIGGFVMMGIDGDFVPFGFLEMVVGSIVSLIGSWMLYGFGEIVEAAEKKINEVPAAPIIAPQPNGTAQPVKMAEDDMAADLPEM